MLTLARHFLGITTPLTAALAVGIAGPSEVYAQDCFPCIRGLGTGVATFGEHITQLDNPRFSHEVILTDREFAERTSQTHMRYDRLQLFFRIDCGADDPLCVSDSMHTARPTSLESVITDGAFTFFGIGPKLGHQWADLFFEKRQEGCEIVQFERFPARVDRETIIVPVHVAVEIPEGNGTLEQLGEPGAWRQFLALFDDDYSDPDGTSPPDGNCASIHTTRLIQDPNRWVPEEAHRMFGIHDVGVVSLSGREAARPDDIFVQCGVQFRLTSVTLLPVQQPTITDESVEPNGAVANFSSRILNAPGRILRYGVPTINGPVVAFMQSVGRANNGTLPTGRSFGSVAGVDFPRMNNRTVAHELGHVLGIQTSVPGRDPHPVCPDDQRDSAGQIMCGNSDTYFMGGCDQWREGIEWRATADSGACDPGDPDPCPPFSMIRPLGCDPRNHPDAQPVCRDIRAAAAKYADALSGNSAPQIDLVDPNGTSLDDLPEGAVRGVGFPGRPKKIECGDELEVEAVLLPNSTDPFPEVSHAMGVGTFTAGESGWVIQYTSPDSGTETELVTYPASTQKITIDLTHRPEDNIWISYAVYDIQGSYGRSSDVREGRPSGTVVITERTDTEPPIIEPLAQIHLDGCAGGEAHLVSFPVDAVEDNCGDATLTGQAIGLNGLPLTPPIPLSETMGALLTNPGDYSIEWIATDQAGNQSEPVLQTVTLDACMGAGSSLQVQNSVVLENPDGSPMTTIVLENGVTHIGGQSRMGGVTSAAPVRVDGGAIVAGDVISASSIDVQAGAVVQGQVQADQALQLPALPGIVGDFPAQCNAAVQYNADAGQHQLAPGCYQELRVGSRTRIVLQDAKYAFYRVLVEPEAILITNGNVFFDVRDDLTFRGRLQLPSGGEGRLALQYRATNVAFVEAPFSGSVQAPLGTLVLGGNHGQVFRGRFYGRNLDVRAGLRVVSEQLGTFGTLSYQERGLNYVSGASAESHGCSTGQGKLPGNWGYLALLSLCGVLVGRRRIWLS